MPDILIRGMEMPTGELNYREIQVWSDGTVCVRKGLAGSMQQTDAKAVELPPHGDLIDVSKVVLEYGGLAKISPHDFVGIAKYFAKQIEGQPAVISAERREEDG